MPVDVCVPLIASETQDVQALRRHGGGNGAADTMDERLDPEMIFLVEVVYDADPMVDGRNKRVAEQGGIAVEEHHGELVAVDLPMREVMGSVDDLADEALVRL